jgi:hypothetical protein
MEYLRKAKPMEKTVAGSQNTRRFVSERAEIWSIARFDGNL